MPRPRVGSSASDAPESLSLDERKQLLIRLCANTDRGKNASRETAALIETQVRALEAANATEFVSRLPKGVQTQIGNVALSGGEEKWLRACSLRSP